MENKFEVNDMVVYENTGKVYRVVKVEGVNVGMFRQGKYGDVGVYMLVNCAKLRIKP